MYIVVYQFKNIKISWFELYTIEIWTKIICWIKALPAVIDIFTIA